MAYRCLICSTFVLMMFTAAASGAGLIDEHQFSMVLTSGSSVIISNMNGNITVEGRESDVVTVTCTVHDPGLTVADAVEVVCDEDEGIACRVDRENHRSADWSPGVDFHVMVPGDLELNIITETFNGDISVSGVSGSALVEIVSGSACLDGIGGRLSVNVVSGTVDIADSPGLVSVNIVRGRLTASLQSILNDMAISSVDGSIDLELPEGARVSASTLSGEMDIPGVSIRHELLGRTASFGSGQHLITVSSFSGDIRIRTR